MMGLPEMSEDGNNGYSFRRRDLSSPRSNTNLNASAVSNGGIAGPSMKRQVSRGASGTMSQKRSGANSAPRVGGRGRKGQALTQ